MLTKSTDSKIYNSIVIFSCFFGSVHIFSNTLRLINNSFLENKIIPIELKLINGSIFIISGSIFMYSVMKMKSIV